MKPFIIGITGGSGSGKTTFIHRLKERFDRHQVCFVSQDDYYLPLEKQAIDEKGICNFDLPHAIDKKAMVKDIRLLMEGQGVSRPEYLFNNRLATPRMLSFEPAPVIIVEGIFVLHFKKVRQLLDLKVFLHAKENLKVIRRIKRDQTERNYPLEDVLYRYEHHVLPTFEKYIKPYMDEADIVINNNAHFEQALGVVAGFIADYLRQFEQVAEPGR